ncbi:MAG: hypothetical protein KF693_00405 [Nitrospira sp.]|nr:hypothetical protein [Nitrospira sp.]
MVRNGDLEINEDLQFQRRMWKVERMGWSAMAILLIGALLGLFGNGPVSWTTASGESLFVEYQRFGRYQAPLQLRLHLQAGLVKDDILSFYLDRAFLADVQITRVTPKPVVEQPISDGIRFIWSSNAKDGSMLVTVSYQPEHIGLLTSRMGVGDAASLSIRQFIFP